MKKILLILAFFAFSLGMIQPVNAATNDILIETEKNANQVDKETTGSFNLKMSPGDAATLNLTISNTGSQKTEVEIAVNDAQTSADGKIMYSDSKTQLLPLEKNPLSKLVSGVPSKITLESGESKKVTMKLQLPEEKFDGVKLAGIHIINAVSKEQKDSMVQNRFAYTVPLMVYETENKLSADVSLESIENKTENNRNFLKVNLGNLQPVILSRGIFEIEIKQGDKVVFTDEKENIELAPSSVYSYRKQWSENEVPSGDFTANIKFDTLYGVWEWSEDFTITRKEAKILNKQVLQVKTAPNYLMIGSIIAIVIAMLIVLFIWIQKKKNNN